MTYAKLIVLTTLSLHLYTLANRTLRCRAPAMIYFVTYLIPTADWQFALLNKSRGGKKNYKKLYQFTWISPRSTLFHILFVNLYCECDSKIAWHFYIFVLDFRLNEIVVKSKSKLKRETGGLTKIFLMVAR